MYYSSINKEYISIDDTPNYLKNELNKASGTTAMKNFSKIKADLEALGNLKTIQALMAILHEKTPSEGTA